MFVLSFVGVLFYCISPTTRHEKCMQIVIEHGADVNNTSNDTCPVFLAACEIASQAESSCLKLLEKGADPNSKTEVRYIIHIMNV